MTIMQKNNATNTPQYEVTFEEILDYLTEYEWDENVCTQDSPVCNLIARAMQSKYKQAITAWGHQYDVWDLRTDELIASTSMTPDMAAVMNLLDCHTYGRMKRREVEAKLFPFIKEREERHGDEPAADPHL